MSQVIRVTNDDELNAHFEGIMIPVSDPFATNHHVPGWKCQHCGWQVGALRYPPAHTCPDDGQKQDELRQKIESETR